MGKQNKKFSKALVALMAVMMMLTMMPSMAFADTIQSLEEENVGAAVTQDAGNGNDAKHVDAPQSPDVNEDADGEGETEPSTEPEGGRQDDGKIQLTLSGMHSAQVASLKLYTYDGGQKGFADLLTDVTAADGAYTVSLDAGSYWVEGYDANGDCNGGVSITVDESHKEFKIQRMYQISVSPSDWKLGEDYTLDVKVTPAGSAASRTVELGTTIDGKGKAWESVRNTCIFTVGDTVEATAVPDATKHANYNPATASKTPTMNESLFLTCKEFVVVNFKAPAGSTITVGTLTSYYVYSYKDAEKSDAANGTATYHLDKGTTYFYRVQNPNGVTYWNYASWSAKAEVNLTADDLYMNSSEFNKNTVYRFDKNVYDRADIYLNINQAGYKNMKVGETFELNSFRNWFAIESYMNAKVALPDMHYEVIDVNGNDSDVVTITPDAKNSNVATMTANKEGTAIVLVTYDAMIHMQGQSSTASKQFSAIWPECTGVFVVTVGADGTGIKTNMQLDRMDATITKQEQKTLDAEHDILFYLGREGAEYSFKPEEGCTVTVARSTVGSKMTFNGFNADGVTTSADGMVTITGLTTGRHIVKVEKDGLANYQVITARGVSYKLVDADGKELTDEAKAALKAGDTVYLQFSNLVSPKEKLSGAYNFNFSLYYAGEDGTYFKSNPGGNFGVYDFSGNPDRQKIAITIPKYWDGSAYTLSGAIKQGGFAGVPTHRGITYAKGTDRGFNAPSVSGILARLPEVTLSLTETEFLTGKLTFKGSDGNSIDRTKLAITMQDAEGIAVDVKDDGTFKAFAEEYSYVISGGGVEYTTGSVTVTDEGRNAFEIVLPVTSETAWDGTSKTEPQKDEAGVYQIGTGAELAWFAENASKNSGIKAKLTADIDLGKYAWTAGKLTNGQCEFDGAGHKVYNLVSSKGLFDTISGSSVVKNLTVEGRITAPEGQAGGIAGCLQSGTIENCVNKATVTGAKTKYNVGGIAGYTGSNTLIKNCVNMGEISGEAQQVGGILGKAGGSGSVEGCINQGTVSGSGKVGGVIGYDESGITIKDCYNTAAITGTDNVGGVIGQAKKSGIANCYNAGSVNKGKGTAFAGSVESSSFEKCYYLKGIGYDENAQELSSEDLKSAELGTGFKLVCKNYPALTWEADKTAHTGQLQETVAPVCGAKGYDLYQCSSCGETYKMNYTDALAHTPDKSKETVFPAYRQEICSVCNAKYKVWNDDRLQYIVLPSKGLETITMSDDASGEDAAEYPWQWNVRKARFESSNKGKSNTTSQTNFTFTLTEEKQLSFDYGVSSDKGYGTLSVILTSGEESKTIADKIGGETGGSFSEVLPAGSYTLTVKFVRGSAFSWTDVKEDMGYITNVKLQDKPKETPTTPEAKPSVTFRLIGCEIAKQDVDLGTNTYLPNYVTWIATTTYTLEELGENATVGTVFKKALDAKGLAYEGYDGNYISSITAPSGYVLSEMTNGPKSGWMYTVNGSHPNKGLLDYQIKDGDVIIWHYVNDYAYEVQDWVEDEGHPALGNSSTWNGWLKAADTVGGTGGGAAESPVEEKKVTTAGEAGSAVTTAPTEVSVSGSAAKASISNETADEMVKQAKENKSSEIVLNVSAAETKNAETIQTEIPKSTLTSIVANTDAQLTITTSQGTLTVDQETMKQMTEEAKGSTVVIEISKVNAPSKEQKELVGEDAQIYKLTAKSGNTEITQFKGTVTVKLPILSSLEDKKVAAVYLENDGKLTQMPGQKITIDKQAFYVFRTNHFSEYALVDAEKTGLQTDEQILEQAKEQLAKVSLTARSVKTAKKNVKVTLKTDAKTAVAIEEIESLGYTVKYKFYRSTKKSSKYAAKLTKASKSYINTTGTKGSRYYYKARVMVYDQKGKLVTYSKLTQCKYAARIWTK